MVFDNNHPLVKYLNAIELLQKMYSELICEEERNFRKNISRELLDEINHEAYEALKSEKHFGLKSEKQRLGDIYRRTAGGSISSYIIKRVYGNEEVKRLKKEIEILEGEVVDFVEKYPKEEIEGTYCFDMEKIDDIHYYSTVLASRMFSYNETVYTKDEILECIFDRTNTKLNGYRCGLLKRLPVMLAKADIWN